MTLDEITVLEYKWLDRQPERGSFEQRHALYQRIGMYEAWQSIFKEYVALARQGNGEALKRALFLYWYSCSEPSELSGLSGLAEDLAALVFGIVDDMARKGELDAELKWMLPYYYMITAWYLNLHRDDKFPDLRKASQDDDNLWRYLCTESSFDNRGQMGKYWRSIQENIERSGPEGPPPAPPDWEPGRPWADLLPEMVRQAYPRRRQSGVFIRVVTRLLRRCRRRAH